MPTYEYRCEQCSHQFEVFARMSDPAPDACESCGGSELVKVLFPVAVHYKGSGFYSTDYSGSKGSSTADSGSSSSGDGGTATGSGDSSGSTGSDAAGGSTSSSDASSTSGASGSGSGSGTTSGSD